MLQVGEWSAEHRLGRRRPGRLRRASPKGSRSAKENPGAWAPGRLVETGSVRHKKTRRTSCGSTSPTLCRLRQHLTRRAEGVAQAGKDSPKERAGTAALVPPQLTSVFTSLVSRSAKLAMPVPSTPARVTVAPLAKSRTRLPAVPVTELAPLSRSARSTAPYPLASATSENCRVSPPLPLGKSVKIGRATVTARDWQSVERQVG